MFVYVSLLRSRFRLLPCFASSDDEEFDLKTEELTLTDVVEGLLL